MYYIYKMIHIPTGRVYIGQRKVRRGKTVETDSYFGSGKVWKSIYNKHKDECVKVVIDTAETKEDIDELERKYIAHYRSVMGEYCVNIADGGAGVGGVKYWLGKKLSDEHRRHLSEAHIGQVVSEEARRKLSQAGKGHKRLLGKKLSDEHKRRISEALKGKSVTDDARSKISASRRMKFTDKDFQERHKAACRKGWETRRQRPTAGVSGEKPTLPETSIE